MSDRPCPDADDSRASGPHFVVIAIRSSILGRSPLVTLQPDHRRQPTVFLQEPPAAVQEARPRRIVPAKPVGGFAVESFRAAIEERLTQILAPTEGEPARLRQAMRHAALSPGKRFRPLLTLLAARRCGLEGWQALDPACAIELVHAASLLLDDLPCMDDAAVRRGQPTAHRIFGEDIAILAAVGLLNEAYGVVAGADNLDGATRASLCRLLAETVGPRGLLGGQEFDLRDRRRATDPAVIARFNHAKTGVLLQAAVASGAIVAGADAEERQRLLAFGQHLGDAFQTLDDMLDATACAQTIRKDVGQDKGRAASVVSLFGKKGVRRAIERRLDLACEALGPRDGADPLVDYVRASFAALAQA